MKLPISLAEPSLANTLDPFQQLCKSKHAQRLCSDISVTELSCLLLLIQNELTLAHHSDRTLARKLLGSTACKWCYSFQLLPKV